MVDEAHHCAPPAPARGKRGYAVDSQHRVLLSATPHNGYSQSWQALLELLDPQRFTRGVAPDPDVLDEVLVRRLTDQIRDAGGNPEFAVRLPAEPLEVAYSPVEREGHALLDDDAYDLGEEDDDVDQAALMLATATALSAPAREALVRLGAWADRQDAPAEQGTFL